MLEFQGLEKHKKYLVKYTPNDIFWGLGVENEFYLDTTNTFEITAVQALQHSKPERYSVKYLEVYDSEYYENALREILPSTHKAPILINSNTFKNVDVQGEHITLYDKDKTSNQKFNGQTIHEYLCSKSKWLKDSYEINYTYDGDTFEIMTQNFYKGNVTDLMNELQTVSEKFIEEIRGVTGSSIPSSVQIMKSNYPFAKYYTNMNNVATFNNGTVHLNITLPSSLNEEGQIQNDELFTQQHCNLARCIQWLEPLLLAVYGTPDPLSKSKTHGHHFSGASQRCAVSRYIGIGTFNTETMDTGKILQLDSYTGKYPWYDQFYKVCQGYKRLDKVGLDINFKKHQNHGLEIRFLDHISFNRIYEVLTFLIYLCDFSLDSKNANISNPTINEEWINFTAQVLAKGNMVVSTSQLNMYKSIFNCGFNSLETYTCQRVYETLFDHLNNVYASGDCVKLMNPKRYKSKTLSTLLKYCGIC